MQTNERVVSFDELESGDAVDKLSVEGRGATRLTDITDSVPRFKKVDDYTTFRAEWDLIGEDVVIHFFVAEKGKVPKPYWLESFPAALNNVAQAHFNATLPRLVAKYTEEDPSTGAKLNSWWFRAQRYSHLLDLEGFLEKFFEKLDAELDPVLTEVLSGSR